MLDWSRCSEARAVEDVSLSPLTSLKNCWSTEVNCIVMPRMLVSQLIRTKSVESSGEIRKYNCPTRPGCAYDSWAGQHGIPMKDLKAELEKLLVNAEDCDLIARLATDKDKRETFSRIAKQLRTMADELKAEILARSVKAMGNGYAVPSLGSRDEYQGGGHESKRLD
jgi:hypothetical protein